MSAKRRRGAGGAGGAKAAAESVPEGAGAFAVRPANAADLAGIIALDKRVTGLAKRDYWHDLFRRYQGRDGRFLLVAAADTDAGGPRREPRGGPRIIGFISGEVRAWEFGSPPCGWVIALSVDPEARLGGVGGALLAAISRDFRAAGVGRMRTMLSRGNHLLMSFFRSHGMTAGPYIQLEMELP